MGAHQIGSKSTGVWCEPNPDTPFGVLSFLGFHWRWPCQPPRGGPKQNLLRRSTIFRAQTAAVTQCCHETWCLTWGRGSLRRNDWGIENMAHLRGIRINSQVSGGKPKKTCNVMYDDTFSGMYYMIGYNRWREYNMRRSHLNVLYKDTFTGMYCTIGYK